MPYVYSRGDNCYGRGDYYRGDYYRGDPGFLSDLWKGVKRVGGAVVAGAVGTLTKGPIGGIASAVGVLTRQGPVPGFAMQAPPPVPVTNVPGVGGFLQRIVPGGATGLEVQPVGTMLSNGFYPGCQLKGTRPNKSGYYKQVIKGDPSQVVYIPPKSVCVRTRRINIANPRALRRAVRRAQGFAKMARRVMTFVSAKAPKGRAKFKRR